MPAGCLGLGVIAAWLAAAPAHANDGVVELNQACATGGVGCLSGDAPGLPVTIGQSGSYRLTGNLVTSDPNGTVIEITAANVSLDLGAFEIAGPAVCGVSFPCTNSGSGRGITSSANNVSVSNGGVRGMGGVGIELTGATCSIDRVRAIANGGSGIYAAGAGQLTNLTSEGNGDIGVFLGRGMLVDSVVARNRNAGISLGGPALVARSLVLSNGKTPTSNASGILAAGDSLLLGNTISFNLGHAFEVTAGTGYGQNELIGTPSPLVLGGIPLGGNLCNGIAC